MAEIINIKNEAGEVQYPVTKPECVIDDNGKSVLTLIQENGTELRQEIDELSERIDNLPKGDEFDAEGNYPLLHVGTADDLAGRGESVPASFGFRASGGKSIKDGRAYIKRIKGNSVVWNQQLPKRVGWSATDGTSYVYDDVADEYTITSREYVGRIQISKNTIAGHKYIICFDLKVTTSSSYEGAYYIGYLGSPTQWLSRLDISNTINKWYTHIEMFTPSASKSYIYLGLYNVAALDSQDTQRIRQPRLIDLTQMFGAGNEPSTIEDFNARVATLGVDLNAYNEGEVIHCNTESIKSVGDNAWDEEWKRGYYMGKEYISVATNQICSANPIPCLPNEAYCVSVTGKTSFPNTIKFTFLDAQGDSIGEVKITNTDQKITTPINATSFLVSFGVDYGDTYKNDILISLYHSGWKAQKDDQYQPYWQDTLPLPIIRKYFPDGMKSAGTAHDEIRFNKASGKWEYSKGKIKSVDMGTLNWVIREYNGYSCFSARQISIGATWDGQTHNFICAKYSCVGSAEIYAGNDKSLSLNNGYFGNQDYKDHIVIRDTSYTDAASFKAAMAGVILYYEAAEWEWVELDAEDQNFRDYYQVADFGTEQSQSSVPSAPFSADIIYQFNAVDMIREHELEITELQKVIATMQAQLTSLINGGQ